MKVQLFNIFLSFLIRAKAFFAGLVVFLIIPLHSQAILTQKESDKLLRLEVELPKNGTIIKKDKNKVVLQTLNTALFSKLVKKLETKELNKDYISKVEISNGDMGDPISKVTLYLTNRDIEVFSFFKDRGDKFVIDFWHNQSLPSDNFLDEKTKVAKSKNNSTKVKNEKAERKIASIVAKAPPKKIKEKRKTTKKITAYRKRKKRNNSNFRDFRYGATFIWNYDPILPKFKKIIDIHNKTAEFFYEVKGRQFKKSEQEATLQIAINLFRKEKFGLMNKAIDLYIKKYPDNNNFDLIDYLKANAILKSERKDGRGKVSKIAMNIYQNILDRSNNNTFKLAIVKFLIQYYFESGDYVATLKYSKKYYLLSKEEFEYEQAEEALESIFYCLAKLNQVDKIENLLKDPTIDKIFGEQNKLAYISYALLKLKKGDQVLKRYEKVKAKFKEKLSVPLVYNIAESYFRNGDYKKAIKLFDEFVTKYSFHDHSDQARLRLALGFDLLEKDEYKVLELYNSAINKTSNIFINYEARLRFVAFNNLRKLKPSSIDIEMRSFIEHKHRSAINFRPGKNLKKLLWQTRLRLLIVDKKYKNALSYLMAIPLKSLTPGERNTFLMDGAEVIKGLILAEYKNSNYPEIIKLWNLYKNDHLKTVGLDPMLNYAIGKSYIKLGLMDSFDKFIAKLERNFKLAPIKSFPGWVDYPFIRNLRNLVAYLKIFKHIDLNNLNMAIKLVNKLDDRGENKFFKHFFYGRIYYLNKKYGSAVEEFEKYFVTKNKKIVYDVFDLAHLIGNYTDSVFKSGDSEKYIKVAKPILRDTLDVASHPYIRKTKEMISYYLLESFYGSKRYDELLEYSKEFKNDYKKSSYIYRINYLVGTTLIAKNEEQKGKRLLEDVINNAETPDSIKELARSDLALLNLENRML